MLPDRDPLDKKDGTFDFPATDDAIVVAFELAGASFAMKHGIPFVPLRTEARADSAPVVIHCPPRQVHEPPPHTDRVPLPNPGLIYPPPLPDESDPDRLRLLHSWYWAGYYTGLADGKKSGLNGQ
jgi:hypothetical protein